MGLAGQDRTPDQDVRPRRNSSHLASGDVSFISPEQVIGVTPDGFLELKLADPSGMGNVGPGFLTIVLPAISGLIIDSTGLYIEVQDPLAIDGNGLLLNIGDGLDLDVSDNLQVALDLAGGLEFVLGDLSIKLAPDSLLELSTDGLSADVEELYKNHVVWG